MTRENPQLEMWVFPITSYHSMRQVFDLPRYILKKCARCGGDLKPDADRYGEYRLCLSCGDEYAFAHSSSNALDSDCERLMKEPFSHVLDS